MDRLDENVVTLDELLLANRDKREDRRQYNIMYARAYRETSRKYVREYLASHPCVDCGNDDYRVLDFDHVHGEKEIQICHAIRKGWSPDKLQKEIDKCEVRCSNCHRIVTYERRRVKFNLQHNN